MYFRPTDSGGVEVVFDLNSINNDKEVELFEVLQDSVNMGMLGSLSVEQEQLEWIAVDGKKIGTWECGWGVYGGVVYLNLKGFKLY